MENSDSVSISNTIYSLPSQGGCGGESVGCESVSTEESVSLPLYYREISYPGDTLYYTAHEGPSYGVAGDPIPYTIHGDSLLTLLLILSFVVLTVSVAQSRRFIGRQLKDFFYISRNDSNISETSLEIRFQFFLVILSCLLMAIATQQYVTKYITETFIVDSELIVISIFFAVYLGFQFFKGLSYTIVNLVFFGKRLNQFWMKMLLFIGASQGMLLFPAILLIAYFNLSLKSAAFYLSFILFFTEILTIYKGWSIFFRQNGGFLQYFLYFCTLEIIPLLSLVAGIGVLIDDLKYNF